MENTSTFEIGTWELSAYFGSEHRGMRKLIKKYEEHFLNFGELKECRQKKTNGRPVDEFRLNEAQTLLMCSFMPNFPKCIEVKKKIIANLYNPELISVTDELKRPAIERVGYVYAIENKSTGLVKIGASVKPKIRVKAICATHGIEDVKVFVSNQVKNHTTIEAKAHVRFADCREFGEWFNISFVDATAWLLSNTEK